MIYWFQREEADSPNVQYTHTSCNISNARHSVSSHFQILRRELKIQRAAYYHYFGGSEDKSLVDLGI